MAEAAACAGGGPTRYHALVGDDAFDLDMATAALRANSSDLPMMLKLLVAQLDGSLGDRLVVERAGGLLRKSEAIKAVQVSLGDDTMRAEVQGSSVRCTIAHTSGGIRIRSEQVEMEVWVRRLLRGLEVEAAHSDAARQALERIVIGGQS